MAPRIPKQNTRFINPQAESSRGRSALEALRGYAGAPSRASVMYPGSQQGYEAGELAGMAEALIPGAAMAKGALGAALAGVIKPRGGNWIPGDVESSISNLFERLGETDPARLAALREQMGNPELGRTGEALGRWIEGPLTKYIKRDMATPEDPVRKLADQGILHMGIPQTVGASSRGIQAARKLAGFPEGGLSITPGGSLWENLSDRVINSGPARYLQEEPKMMAENPWMQKLDPESTVYSMPSSIERGLGFDHLIDELGNAMNPESGLPRNLLLRPEQMQQMGMEKAVRHVDAINKWRAAQQAAANAELANRAMVVREYAENNPKGLRWVELKAGDPDENMLSSLSPSDRARYERYLEKGDSPLEAMRASMGDENPIVKELERQLKYEGDTMGHCVGGYCPDVLEGNSRIFSLRDAKGEPHVTVEVAPGRAYTEDDVYDLFPGGVTDAMKRGELGTYIQDKIKTLNENPVSEIVQIKGKQNLAPKDEYLPFVQDFVRNSPLGVSWGRVGDLKNTGLRKVGDRYVTPDELKDVPKTPDGLPIGYEPLDDLPEWAEGGLVAQPDYFDDLDAFLRR